MDRFEALWRAAIEGGAAFARQYAAAADVAATQRSLKQLHVPGRLAIMSGGGGDGPVGHDLIERRTRAFEAPRATPTTNPHARLARVASPRLRGR